MIPLHPVLVHFPLAFFILECVFLTLWRVRGDDKYLDFSLYLFVPAYIFLCAAMVSGYRSSGGFGKMGDLTRQHFYASSVFFVISTLRAFVWKTARKNLTLQLVSAWVGIVVLFLAGYWGGLQVYS